MLSLDAGAVQEWKPVYKNGKLIGVTNGFVLWPVVTGSNGVPSGQPVQLKSPPSPDAAQTDPTPAPATDDDGSAPPAPPQSNGTPAPVRRSSGGPGASPAPPAVTGDSQTEAYGPSAQNPSPYCATGKCSRRQKIPDKIPTEKIAGQQDTGYSGVMSCGQKKLLRAAKSVAARIYGNANFWGGNCGAGVGDSIVGAGFPFPAAGRYAIKYMKMLPDRGWTKLNITDVKNAPPGSVLVYAGPCTKGYEFKHPDYKCHKAGDFVGHVTIKGDPKMDNGKQWYYTDGRLDRDAPRRRHLVGVFIPGPSQNAKCGG